MKVCIPNGKSAPYEIDTAGKNVCWVVSPKDVAPCEDEEAEVRYALQHPIEALPLRELLQKRSREKGCSVSDLSIVITVDDSTRVTPAEKILLPLLREFHACGISDQQVTILFALGTHRPMTTEEMIAKVGFYCFSHLKMQNHDCNSAEALQEVGITSRGTHAVINKTFAQADVKICTGNIIPQFIAGWAGGAKSIEPGIAGADTTAMVHLRGSLDWPGRLGNPENDIRLDMEEIGRLAGVDYILNTVLNLNNELVHVVFGDLVAAHRKGVEYAREIYEARIPRRADVVICGTYPANRDLWQADKALAAATLMTKPGGNVIWCPPCEEGACPEHPEILELGAKPPEEVHRLCQAGKIKDVVGATGHIMIGVMRQMANITLVTSGVTAEEASKLGFQWAPSIESALKEIEQRAGKASIGILTHGADMAPVVEEEQ